MRGDAMRRWKLISFLLVVMLGLLALVPSVSAASTFAADLNLYMTRNKTTSKAATELTAYVAAERAFARPLGRAGPRTPEAVRLYLAALDKIDSFARRIVRDQKASDRLLDGIVKLAGSRHTEAAWILLRRGLASQERFLKTIAETRLLVTRCRVLRARLAPTGG